MLCWPGKLTMKPAFLTLLLVTLCGCGPPAAESCRANLRQMASAKRTWALERNKTTNDIPVWSDIGPYLKAVPLECPRGGTYTLGRAGQVPTCSAPGHTIE